MAAAKATGNATGGRRRTAPAAAHEPPKELTTFARVGLYLSVPPVLAIFAVGILGLMVLSDENSPLHDTIVGAFWRRAIEVNYVNLAVAVNFPIFYLLWVVHRLRQAAQATALAKKK
mmetsp:Transcript_9021/g.33203  ORF Transcript_9021/g.33203 Transcript_9021/m.33203 type:complete len:117 (-) Transcript_9021:243-593(-)